MVKQEKIIELDKLAVWSVTIMLLWGWLNPLNVFEFPILQIVKIIVAIATTYIFIIYPIILLYKVIKKFTIS